jgi:hypothetical protein
LICLSEPIAEGESRSDDRRSRTVIPPPRLVQRGSLVLCCCKIVREGVLLVSHLKA